jgi:hypothetical protein
MALAGHHARRSALCARRSDADRAESIRAQGGLLHKTRFVFDSLQQALNTDTAPQPIDWSAMEQAWSRAHEALPAKVQGNTWQLAAEVAHRLGSCRGATMASNPP